MTIHEQISLDSISTNPTTEIIAILAAITPSSRRDELIRPHPVIGKAIGSTYFTFDSVCLGLMTMSYFGRVAERCSRISYSFISLAATRTPSGYVPSKCSTVGCAPFQVIRRAHRRTTSRLFSNTPFHFRSSDDQQRSIRLYLL